MATVQIQVGDGFRTKIVKNLSWFLARLAQTNEIFVAKGYEGKEAQIVAYGKLGDGRKWTYCTDFESQKVLSELLQKHGKVLGEVSLTWFGKTETGTNWLKAYTRPEYDVTGGIIAYESGELDDDGVIELFQHLDSSGTLLGLQGSYQRTAARLRSRGLI